jgi:hypothetical protein
MEWTALMQQRSWNPNQSQFLIPAAAVCLCLSLHVPVLDLTAGSRIDPQLFVIARRVCQGSAYSVRILDLRAVELISIELELISVLWVFRSSYFIRT